MLSTLDIAVRWTDNPWMRIMPVFVCLFCLSTGLLAQNSNSQSETTAPGLNSVRSSQSHSEENGRITDKQTLERIGMDGRYVTYLDVERESVKVNATTVRTTERTYGRDADGRRTLTQVVEEVKSASPGEAEKVVRNTSSPDADGRLHLVRREVEETKHTARNVEETKTTAYTPASDGQMVPSVETQERRTRTGEHEVRFQRSTMLPDVNGKWQTQEVREGVIKDDGREQGREERISRPNNDGQLAVVERTVTRSMRDESGEGKETVESYSTSSPGSADEGQLRLNQKITTIRRKTLQGGTATEQQVLQRSPGDPGSEPRLAQRTIDIVRPTSSGGTEHQQQTISIDTNGSSNVVWVDIGRSSKAAVQKTPNQPKVTNGGNMTAKSK